MTASPSSLLRSRARWAAASLSALLLAACGGGGDDAASPGTRAKADAAALAVPIAEVQDPLLQNLDIPADAPTRGMWSKTQDWPMNGLHAALLPDGRVLTYGTPQGRADLQDGRTSDVWNPALGFAPASHTTSFDADRVNSFCGAAAWRPDGTLMVTGGNSPLDTSLFAPASGTGTADRFQLADQRWYGTMLTLPDGRQVMLGGMDPYAEDMQNNPDAAIANGTISMTPEIYTQGTGWRSLTGARSRDAFGPDYLRGSYPRAWVMPSGLVAGISAERLWALDVNANNGAGQVTVYGAFKSAPSARVPVNVGATSSAAMFAPGKVLQAGGNGGYNGDALPASNKATVVDFTGGKPVVKETAAMAYARRFPNLTVLPDGNVVATGGTRYGNNGGGDAVFAAEIWKPASGAWTLAASAAQVRVYHSAALLLPNGTVLSTGGGAPGPVNNLNAEVFYPPYLFQAANGAARLAPRPVVTAVSATSFGWGATALADVKDGAAVARVTLTASGMVTHAFNSTQRFQELSFTRDGNRLSIALPANANLAPPGYYQLAVLDAQGVPSRAVTIAIGMNGVPTLTPGSTQVFDAMGAAQGQAIATGAGQLGVLAAAPAAAPDNTRFIVRQGLADAACLSLESVAVPGQYLRHQNFRLRLSPDDGAALTRADATFCPEAGLAGSGITLRPKNFPGSVLRHRNGELWVDPQGNDAGFIASASFQPRRMEAGDGTGARVAASTGQAPAIAANGTARYNPGLDASGLSFSWDFGDGTAPTAFSNTSAIDHGFGAPGLYTVTLTTRDATGRTSVQTFMQAVYGAPTANAPRASSALLLESRGGGQRLWAANPDTDTVSLFDTDARTRTAEIAVGRSPRSLALAPDGRLWVVNKADASISVIDTAAPAVVQTIALPPASQPHGLVFAQGGSAYLALEASGQVLKLDAASGTVQGQLAVGSSPRHLSLTGDGATLLVSRFITPPQPGESTARVDAGAAGGVVAVVDTARFAVARSITLRHSDKTDTEIGGAGVPNYLGAAVISPDGTTAWVPSKQDNILRGGLRNGRPLNFENTVRAISSKIDLSQQAEVYAARIDHDNASLASAAVYDATGSYLFVALETARQVEVADARTGARLFRIEVGLAPQALAVSADNQRLYVQNFMGRSIDVIDLAPLTRYGQPRANPLGTMAAIGNEKLPAQVLRGKQLFYDARDTRLARDAYMSCASCHNDGGHDGRTWDLSSLGEGLRNTSTLRGHARQGQGLLHWSGNFDEVQDFEAQIRLLAGGSGLMSDADFNTGTRSQPLGDKKVGISADLDALAAYVNSLATADASPERNADGTLTAAALAGQAVFNAANCASCHGGTGFGSSSLAGGMRNVGTLKVASGNRLGAPLAGLNVPTLRGVWATGPWLHDGSAPTLQAAVAAHAGNAVGGTDLDNLAAYLRSIDARDPAPPRTLPNGVYRLVAQHSNQVLAVDGANTAAGTDALQWPFSGTDDQRWQLARQGDGSYTLSPQHSGQMLEVAGCGAGDGARAQQAAASGTACQRWKLDPLADGSFRVTNQQSGKVLDVAGISMAAGAAVHQWTWTDGPNQHWRIEPVSPNGIPAGIFTLAAQHSGKVLDVAGASAAAGAAVFQWPDWGGANQRWIVTPTAEGFFTLAPTHQPGMRLQAQGGGLDDGVPTVQAPANLSAAQNWAFQRQADGSYVLTNVNSGKVLDVRGVSQADGAVVHQWTRLDAPNQRWKLGR